MTLGLSNEKRQASFWIRLTTRFSLRTGARGMGLPLQAEHLIPVNPGGRRKHSDRLHSVCSTGVSGQNQTSEEIFPLIGIAAVGAALNPLRLQTGTQGMQSGGNAMQGQRDGERATVGELVGDVGTVAATQGGRKLIRDLGQGEATLGAAVMEG